MKTPAISYQSLSLFRILLAVYLLVDFFLNVFPFMTELFTNQGLQPLKNLAVAQVVDHPLFQGLFVFAHVAGIICFGIGYRTRAATVVTFLTFVALFWHYDEYISGAETVARLLLLWSLFLPLSRYWSVDAALDTQPRDRPHPYLPIFAIKLQISMIYLMSAIWKLAGEPWLQGWAVERALRDTLFGGTTAGLYMANHWGEWLWIANYAVIVLQILFTPMIYSPWRNNLMRGTALALAALMHIGFMIFLKVGSFPYICLVYLVILVPDEWWNMLREKWRQRQKGIRIFYDPDCAFCYKTALLFREFCLPASVPVQPANQDAKTLALLKAHNSWVVYDADGNAWFRWRAVAYVLRQNPVFWVFGWLSDFSWLRALFDRVYQWIGRSRRTLGKLAGTFLPFRSEGAPGKPALAVCVFLILVMLGDNILCPPWQIIFDKEAKRDFDERKLKVVKWKRTLRKISFYVQTHQQWTLFAPTPVCYLYNYNVTGRLADGTVVDILPRLPAAFFTQRDENGYSWDVALRAAKYLRMMRHTLAHRRGSDFQNYLCYRANEDESRPFVPELTIRAEIRPAPRTGSWCAQGRNIYEEVYACPPRRK